MQLKHSCWWKLLLPSLEGGYSWTAPELPRVNANAAIRQISEKSGTFSNALTGGDRWQGSSLFGFDCAVPMGRLPPGKFNFPSINLLALRAGEDKLRVATKQTLMPLTMSNACVVPERTEPPWNKSVDDTRAAGGRSTTKPPCRGTTASISSRGRQQMRPINSPRSLRS